MKNERRFISFVGAYYLWANFTFPHHYLIQRWWW